MIDFNLLFVAVLAFLQLADVISTHVILGRGGRELNPILHWLFQHANPLWVMGILKTVFIAMCIAADLWWLSAGLCVFYGYIVFHNFKEMEASK